MLKKVITAMLIMLIALSVFGCSKKSNKAEKPNEVAKAIENGDYETAYSLLYNNKNRSESEEELFSRFAFVLLEEKYSDGKITYTYDENGYMTTRYDTGDSGYWSKTTYAYDEKGNLVSENFEAVSDVWSKRLYSYDENSNIIGEPYETSDGFSLKREYTYDSKGNMLSKSSKLEGEITENRGATYTYELRYYPNGAPKMPE